MCNPNEQNLMLINFTDCNLMELQGDTITERKSFELIRSEHLTFHFVEFFTRCTINAKITNLLFTNNLEGFFENRESFN